MSACSIQQGEVIVTAQITVHPGARSARHEKAERLRAELQALAREHVAELAKAMLRSISIARDVEEGADAYPPGARDLCRVMADDLTAQLQTLSVISSRN